MELRNCSVIGSSFGGLVGALLHLERLVELKALVLAGSGSIFNTPEQQAQVLKASAANALSAMQRPSYASLLSRMKNIVFDAAAVEEVFILVQMASYASPIRARAYADIIQGVIDTGSDKRGQVSGRISGLTLPILLLAGKQDPRSPVDRQIEGVKGLKDGRLIIYERCGHFPFLEHPVRFAADIATFLCH
jgi:pimeloyl-ACP methyl ester carboxylesterase